MKINDFGGVPTGVGGGGSGGGGTGGGGTGGSAGGDLSGSLPGPTVSGVDGIPLAAPGTAASGDTLVYNAGSNEWDYAPGGGGASPLTTKGDLYGYDTADARIPVGSNGQVLTADSTDAQGVSWQTATGGGTFHGAKAYNSATQTINNTNAACTLNSEEFDSDAYHDTSTNTSRMTIPAGLGGKYLLQGGGFWSASGSWLGFKKNGSTALRGYHSDTGGVYGQANAVVDLAAGDYVELWGNSTGNVTLGHASLPDAQTWFSCVLLSPVLATLGPGTELDYVAFTSPVSVTATTEATANTVVTANAVTFDGSTVAMIEFYAPYVTPGSTGGSNVICQVNEGATVLGYVTSTLVPSSAQLNAPASGRLRLTPSAASHTYSIRAFRGTANGTVGAGAGGTGAYAPGFIRIVKV